MARNWKRSALGLTGRAIIDGKEILIYVVYSTTRCNECGRMVFPKELVIDHRCYKCVDIPIEYMNTKGKPIRRK